MGLGGSTARPRRGGFALGVRCGLRGVGRCVTTPALWPWALVPAALTFALLGVPLWLLHDAVRERVSDVVAGWWDGRLAGAASTAVGVLLFVVSLVVVYLVVAPLARVVAAPFLALLSDRTLRTVAGTEPAALPGGRLRRYVVVPLRDALVFLAIRAVATVLLLPLLCVPVVGGVLLFVALVPLEGLDRMDVAQSSRAVRLRHRLGFLRRQPGACIGLGLVSGALLLVPVANVLLLPGLVVGAVLLDAEVSPDFPRAAPEAAA